MKTKLMNFRVEESVYAKIKRAAEAAHETMTDFLLTGAAMRMKAMKDEPEVIDPIGDAFDELFRSGKVSPLTDEEKEIVRDFEARKAAGTYKTVPIEQVIAELDAQIARETALGKRKVGPKAGIAPRRRKA
jgi:hypothetical protein